MTQIELEKIIDKQFDKLKIKTQLAYKKAGL